MERQHLSQTKNAIAPPQTQSHASDRSSAHPIEELQGAIGNRAVNKLLANQPTLQAKPMFGGLSRELVIQPKLAIGAVGDKYEQEADRVAADVVQRIHTPASQTGGETAVQRQVMEDEEEAIQKSEAGNLQRVEISEINAKSEISNPKSEAPADLEASIQSARGSGQPLSQSVREPMEREFGRNFAGVRVHTDATSDRLNQSIQAKAFTTGQDIFFRSGVYEPQSQRGQELIAHELTHVVQQKPNLIQRAVGLEYEITDWKCEDESTSAPLEKFDLIEEALSEGWELRADSIGSESVLEFQTKAKAKSEDMLAAVGSMQEFAEIIQDDVQKNKESIVNGIRIFSDNPEMMDAHIQATMGVPLRLIPQLYQTLSSQQDWFKGKASLKRWQEKRDSKAPNGRKLSKLSHELQGFLLLLIDYQKQGYLSSQQKKVPKWSHGAPNLIEKFKTKKLPSDRETATTNLTKDLYSLMLRTDFRKAFSLLPPTEQKEIVEIYDTEDGSVTLIKQEWVKWIEKLALGDKKDLNDEIGQLLSMYQKGYKSNESGEVTLERLDLKRRDWLQAMPTTDLLANNVGLGVGSYGKKVDVGVGKAEGEEALIVELRDLRLNADRPQWSNQAKNVADIYDKVLDGFLFEVPSKKKLSKSEEGTDEE